MSSKNIKHIFDDLNQEDYLCHKLRPKGFLRCSHCHEYYEEVPVDDFGVGCSKCGSFDEPYEEE